MSDAPKRRGDQLVTSQSEDVNTVVGAQSPEFDRPAELDQSVPDPSFADIAELLFDLNSRDVETLTAVCADPGASINRIAERTERNRSNVSRSIRRLRELDLVARHRRVINTGGYYYAHYARPDEELAELFTAAVEQWATAAREAVTDRSWDDPTDD